MRRHCALFLPRRPEAFFSSTNHVKAAPVLLQIALFQSLSASENDFKGTRKISHAFGLKEEVRHHAQGPQVRLQAQEPQVYTIVQRMPIEADGRLRYRIKSEKLERVVAENELSYAVI